MRLLAVIHTVARYQVFRVVFLAEGDGSFLTATSDVHAEGSRHVAHVEHLKLVHQLLLELVEQSLAGAEEHNFVHVERQEDEANLVLVHVYARVWLKRAKADDGELLAHRARLVFRSLPKTVQDLAELHDETNSCFVVGLVAGRHFDEHVLFDVGFEECCLRV